VIGSESKGVSSGPCGWGRKPQTDRDRKKERWRKSMLRCHLVPLLPPSSSFFALWVEGVLSVCLSCGLLLIVHLCHIHTHFLWLLQRGSRKVVMKTWWEYMCEYIMQWNQTQLTTSDLKVHSFFIVIIRVIFINISDCCSVHVLLDSHWHHVKKTQSFCLTFLSTVNLDV